MEKNKNLSIGGNKSVQKRRSKKPTRISGTGLEAKLTKHEKAVPQQIADEQEATQESAVPNGASPPGPPIVGIGASAGGLEAFKKFFRTMPADSGVAFVLVPHLDPTHKSLMVELLARQTKMPVCKAQDGMPIEPNRVYVIPPNRYLSISDGKLRLCIQPERHGAPTAIDYFLSSLAAERRERAIGIILSGTSTHGTLGIKEIKLAGGMVMVQQPESADFDAMPRSAIATGLVDFVLPPQLMPDTLVKYIRHPYVRGPTEQTADEVLQNQLARILAVIKTRSKCDFRSYRKNMLMRRVLRRMGLSNLEQISDYLDYLRTNPDEVLALSRDLLIGVTDFFRDPEAFQVLQERVIPKLVGQVFGLSAATADDFDGQSRRPDIRVWVPACSSGEEAYTIAMLLIEFVSKEKQSSDIQVFATDIDERSLEAARLGVYSESSISGISPERLQRFFTKVGPHQWKINKQLREAVTIAPQNLISDAPFSKLNLISCRNLLIYLEPEVQAKAIRMFHFALADGGYLLMGQSESIGRETELFEPVSKKWRVFKRIGQGRRNLTEIPIMANEERRRLRMALPPSIPAPAIGFKELMQRLVLDEFAPAAALINRQRVIVCVLGPLVNYLEFPPGKITYDFLAMSRPGLRAKIRAAVYKAIHSGETVVDREARVKRNGAYTPCSITIKPVVDPKDAEGLLLVVFQDCEAASSPGARSPDDEDPLLLQHLEHELKSTRDDLQGTIGEYERSTEELQASNEEVMSMNEELQSSNEELETSKEELQSLNEELRTVNSQLQEKVEELDKSNSDLTNLMASSDVATVFLDADLRIKRFTPPVAELLNLRPTDMDRPIGDLAPKFNDATLLNDCRQVLTEHAPLEKEVWTKGDQSRIASRQQETTVPLLGTVSPPDSAGRSSQPARCYLRRILPYRTAADRIDGVVVTLVDITQRVAADVQSRRLASAIRDSNDAITLQDLGGRILAWNRGAEQIYGYTEAEALQMNIRETVPERRQAEVLAFVERLASGRAVTAFQTQRLTKDGRILDIELTVTTFHDEHGQTIGVATTERDVTHRNELQKQVLEVAADEQRRIGQELHDGTGQELTGLALFAAALVDLLQETPRRSTGGESTWHFDEAELLRLQKTAQRILSGLEEANRHVQQLSHGILPVQIEAEGLKSALQELAAATDSHRNIKCLFECPEPISVVNTATATHLYRISQEAVNNALRHSRAQQMRIALFQDPDSITLEISDDGIGFEPADLRRSQHLESGSGFGLGIMNYRAGIIGGRLHISRNEGGGTLVKCVIPRGDVSP